MEIDFHRFNDRVAFAILPNDAHGTVYLTAAEAQEISEVFAAYAQNIRMTSFTDSEMGGHSVQIANSR